MSTIKNSGLDQYDAEPFEQKQFGTAGVEGVNVSTGKLVNTLLKDWTFSFICEWDSRHPLDIIDCPFVQISWPFGHRSVRNFAYRLADQLEALRKAHTSAEAKNRHTT